jgi:hypothetical protein
MALQDIYFMIWILLNQLLCLCNLWFWAWMNYSSNKLLCRLVNLNHHTNNTIFLLLWPIQIDISSHWLTAQIVLWLLFDRRFVKGSRYVINFDQISLLVNNTDNCLGIIKQTEIKNISFLSTLSISRKNYWSVDSVDWLWLPLSKILFLSFVSFVFKKLFYFIIPRSYVITYYFISSMHGSHLILHSIWFYSWIHISCF